MIIFKHPDSLSPYLESLRNCELLVGFVPTMGALHQGHLSLLEQSQKAAAVTVCSIFINPTQFNDQRDYEKYPISVEADIDKIESMGTDILFLPDVRDLYPAGTTNLEKYNLGYLETVLEGEFRPGHFQGVCQVMSRLMKIVRPAKLFMGQKDYQQSLVIQHLIHAIGIETELVTCPTTRETSGLAMSSRNMRLNEQERKQAQIIFQALTYIKQGIQIGELANLKEQARALLTKEGLRIEYLEVADAHTLKLADSWDGEQELVALVAAYMHDVRLIDNMLLNS